MECFKIDYKFLYNHNLIYPLLGLSGLFMTYLGNKFVRPSIFTLGTILSTGSSYKLTHLIMNQFQYNNCLVKCSISLISGFSGGYLALKLYKITYFTLGFVCGGSFGYLLHGIIFFKYKLGMVYNYDIVFWLSLGIPGILSGLISMYKEQELSIMTTAFVGPLLSVYSFNQFTNYYNLYIFIPVYLFMVVTGLFVQYEKYKIDKLKITYGSKI